MGVTLPGGPQAESGGPSASRRSGFLRALQLKAQKPGVYKKISGNVKKTAPTSGSGVSEVGGVVKPGGVKSAPGLQLKHQHPFFPSNSLRFWMILGLPVTSH